MAMANLEILALKRGPSPDQQTLVAFSPVGGRQMWVRDDRRPMDDLQRDPSDPSSDWPMLVDLDQKGGSRIEIAGTGFGDRSIRGDYRGIRLLDGKRNRQNALG